MNIKESYKTLASFFADLLGLVTFSVLSSIKKMIFMPVPCGQIGMASHKIQIKKSIQGSLVGTSGIHTSGDCTSGGALYLLSRTQKPI